MECQENKKRATISISDIVSALYGGEKGVQYSENIHVERDKLIEALKVFQDNAKNIEILKGEIAEIYHAGTFNINAAQKGATVRAEAIRSNEFGSADIELTNGKKFQLKYYNNGKESAKAQAKSFGEAAKNPSTSKGANKALEAGNISENKPIYEGQGRVIPEDQIDEAKRKLQDKIAKESVNRPEQVEKYQDTLNNITDRVDDGEGIHSTPLSKDKAKEIAKDAKEGKITDKSLELTDSDVTKIGFVIKNAAKCGLEASAVTAGVSLVVALFQKYQQENKTISDYTLDDWEDIFGTTIFKASTAGISAATLNIVGSYCKAAVPGASALIMATFGIASLVPDLMEGKISQEEFIVEAEMVCLDAAITLLGTVVGQMTIPIAGLGGILGALAASIAWSIINEIWGEELRQLLDKINENIKNTLEDIKEFFEDIWEKIVAFFENLAEHIKLLMDEDFNYNMRHKYKKINQVKDEMIVNEEYNRRLEYGTN